MWYDSLEKSKDNMVYHFVKDGQGNVIGLMNYYDAEAWYSYDAWGNCKVLNPDGTVNTKAEFIGNINPIRWKSQYYDAESWMYYIRGNITTRISRDMSVRASRKRQWQTPRRCTGSIRI